MVDTVRVEYCGRWRGNTPDGWTAIESRRTVPAPDGSLLQKCGRMMANEETGVRVGGDMEYAWWFEASLPRVLLGCNGLMIATEEQLVEAIAKTLQLVESVCEPMLNGKDPRCTRLDLVGQFLVEPQDMLTAHRESTHPRIRGRKSYYEGESLHFVGKERHLRIYDKVKEMSGKPGHVTRVEWQLRGEAMRHDLNRDFIGLKNLTIEDLYAEYRRLCLELVPSSLPVDSTLYDILAAAGREGTKLQGLALFDFWARGKHPKTVRRVRREVAKRRECTFSIDWHQLLPPDFGDFPIVAYHEPNPF